jgi:hypothetical protein
MDQLNATLTRVGTAAYQAASPMDGPGMPGSEDGTGSADSADGTGAGAGSGSEGAAEGEPAGAGARSGGSGSDSADDAVEGEFKEV